MIDLLLAGKTAEARANAADPSEPLLPRLPPIDLEALAGGTRITNASLDGRVVLVEFWATWCPPCRGTLQWLGDLKMRYGDKLEVVMRNADKALYMSKANGRNRVTVYATP